MIMNEDMWDKIEVDDKKWRNSIEMVWACDQVEMWEVDRGKFQEE